MKLIYYFFFILSVILKNIVKSKIIVETTNGLLRGKLVDDFTLYYSYTGIPYAEPPIGKLRFMPPTPKTSWEGILDATEYGPVCVQPQRMGTKMSEDCLYLNVFVPAFSTGPFPVFFHVSGGGFRNFDNDVVGPQLLLQRDIIVVIPQFRIGSLGFLSLGTKEASGNAGIKDAILALKWVKQNIMNFNGDPNNITVCGTSTGAIMVNYMLITNKTTNLFQRSILLSGSALTFRGLALHPIENALALGEILQFNTSATDILLQNLLEIDVSAIIEAENNMAKNDRRKGFRQYVAFAPCIEIDSDHAIITKHPLDTMESGVFQNVSLLVICSAQDGMQNIPAVLKNPELIEYLNEDFELCIPSNIEYPYDSKKSIELANSIRHIYFKDSNIPKDSFGDLINVVGDSQFFYPINSMVKLFIEAQNDNGLYYGEFSFDGELNWGKLHNHLNLSGTDHGDILGYIFVTNETRDRLKKLSEKSERMMDIMLTSITNFVKFGNPTPTCYTECDAEWEDYGKSGKFMLLNETPKLVSGEPGSEHLQFWYDVYDQYYEYKKNGGIIQKKIVP